LTWRAEPCCFFFNVISGTSGGRISALDDSLNDFLTFLEKEFNKEKECAKTSFNWGGAHGSDTSNHVAI
jgi:hypothetical protein